MVYFSPIKTQRKGGLPLDRYDVKRRARAILQSQKKPIFLSSALFVALILIFSYLSFRLTGPNDRELQSMVDALAAGDALGAQEILLSLQPSFLETFMSDFLSYLQSVVAYGFLLLLLRASREKEVQPGMLLDGFGSLIRVLLLVLITKLIVTLGFLLLIIPGIVFLYNYRMARYLMILHPEYSPLDCLRESRTRMRGWRLQLFLLDLSFLGWALLCTIPVLGLVAALWALPYWNCSCLLFYDEISAGLDSKPPFDEDQYPL